MAKRDRKRLIASSRKKLKGKSAKSNESIKNTTPEESKDGNNNNNEEEAWMLMEFTSFEDLSIEDAPMCNSDECKLGTLHAHE